MGAELSKIGYNTDTISVNSNEYKHITVEQLPVGNYDFDEDKLFNCYYALHNFVYIVYNKMKSGQARNLSAEKVVESIGYRFGMVYCNIVNDEEIANIVDLKFSSEKDLRVRILTDVNIIDTIDLITETDPIKLHKPDTQQQHTRLLGMSKDLSDMLTDIYNKVTSEQEFPTSISDFYYKCFESDNPFKRISKPYALDADYITENVDTIKEFWAENSSKGLTVGVGDDKTFWEEMVYKAVAIAAFYKDRDFSSSEHDDIYKEFSNLVTNTTAGQNDTIKEYITKIFKSCIANQYRILFVKGINKMLESSDDPEKAKDHWNKIRKTCVKLFSTSIYSLD